MEQKKKEKDEKEKLDKLLKMKPKDYKNVSNKEKDEIKFLFEYQKSTTKTLEEIQKLEGMNA